MDEKELKTSPKQRAVIIVIAILMLGSIIASYAAIILNGSKTNNANDTTTEIDQAKIAEYEEAYNKVQDEFSAATKGDYERFIKYKSRISAYNESTANADGIKITDVEVGSGKEIKDGSTDYLAYYVGWCADEEIFDSSFDDNDKPTAFAKILDPSLGMIEGWTLGVDGMKLEGIREITMPSELAYKDQDIACGANKPLKFLVYIKEKTSSLSSLSNRLDDAYMRLQYANYGIDYDSIRNNTD